MSDKSHWRDNIGTLAILTLCSIPLMIMFLYLFIDTITDTEPGSLIPSDITFSHWHFLTQTPSGMSNIWRVTLNTLIFATSVSAVIVSVSLTAGYALSRLKLPFRAFFLASIMALHAFPTITLVIALFIILQMVGLYNTLVGVILIKAALMLPFGIWVMKGFYDAVPWELEMAGVQDGASRFTVWRRIVLPQIKPGLIALGVFSFLEGWSEFLMPQIFAPGANVQVLSVYLAQLIADDQKFDFNLFKSVGLFYVLPVLCLYLLFQNKLMNIYSGGSKG